MKNNILESDLLCDGAIVLANLDNCISGISNNGLLIYSYEKLINHFINEEEMTEDDAIEWIDYNIFGLLGNGKGFIIMYNY